MQVDHTTPLCFVDLETTGISTRTHRIIEIGIVRIECGQVVREYRTLLNPDTVVPPFVVGLTGIGSDMLVDAPHFEDIAQQVAEVLDGALFLAHNVTFDYSFLTEEYRRIGMSFTHPYVCTAKLSRKLFPKLSGHSVDALVARFGLDAGARHRALDDALVLKQFVEVSRRRLGDVAVLGAMQDLVRIRRLPHHIQEDMINRLPDGPGVYFFYGKDDELLYIGKSRRLRTRVRAHFAKDGLSGHGQDMLSCIRRVDYQATVGELGALLLETHLLKVRRPIFNAREQHADTRYVTCVCTAPSGYAILRIVPLDVLEVGLEHDLVSLYGSNEEARADVRTIAIQHSLCFSLVGLDRDVPCVAYQAKQCVGACTGVEKPRHYNKRFREAFAERALKAWPFSGPVVVEERSSEGVAELYVVDRWRIITALRQEHDIWSELVPAPYRFEYDVYKLLARELLKKSPRVTISKIPRAQDAWSVGSYVVTAPGSLPKIE